MKTSPWRIGLLLLCGSFYPLPGAGISTDGSMGAATTLTGPVFVIPANLGTQRGGNLFHSFNLFNLLNGETADFTATGSVGAINNIIARVTGGASSIDGTIRSDIPGANLFLLNSAGVMFGANAHVNVTGAFAVGTPDYVKLADGVGKFNTSLGGDDNLTSATISAFGFLTNNPQAVRFSQSNLNFATAASITIIGGDILLDGATLQAAAGKISMFSAKGAGEVGYDAADPGSHFGTTTVAQFGNVTLQNGSKVAIDSAQGGGKVVIRGGVMVMLGSSRITSVNSGAAQGGNVEVHADSLSFADNSNILTTAQSSGNAGNVDVTANSMFIDGSLAPAVNDPRIKAGLGSLSETGATGNAGNVAATVAGDVTIKGSGEIVSNTNSNGNAGNVTVHAQSLLLDGSATPGAVTGITSTAYTPGTTGQGGIVDVTTTGSIAILDGAYIAADTFSLGHAGQVNLQADSLAIDGSTSIGAFTGLSSASNAVNPGLGGAGGDGGSINLNITHDISLFASGAISTATNTSGNAGNIDIHADSLSVDGASLPGILTGIASSSGLGSTGTGGDIVLHIDHALSIADGGAITADTRSQQRGGDIDLHAGSLLIDGKLAPTQFTGVSSSTGDNPNSGNPATSGHGGNVTVNVGGNFTATGGGGIEEETFSQGDAGTLTVKAGNIVLSNGGFISGDTFFDGAGGAVTVTARSISIDGAGDIGTAPGSITGIASDSNSFFQNDGTGTGGNVSVTATDSLSIKNKGRIAALTETQGNGGDVLVTSGNVSLSGRAQISASSSNPGTAPLVAGDAGTVMLHVGNITLDSLSTVATSAIAANAGSINLTGGDVRILNGSSFSTSAGANGGNITLQVSGTVYVLNSNISATAGALQLAGVGGAGGNITIGSNFTVLNNSLISANAAAGQGGNIKIITNDFLNNQSAITATGATNNGTITITAPNLDLADSLIALSDALVSDENRLRESCTRSIGHEFSSFIAVGRGGTETGPDELQADFGIPSTPPSDLP